MKKANDTDTKMLLERTNKLLKTLVVLMIIFFVYYVFTSFQTRGILVDIDNVIRHMRVF